MARRKDKYSRLPPPGAANEAAPAPAAHSVEVPASSVHAYTNSLLERVIQLLLISLLSIGVQISYDSVGASAPYLRKAFGFGAEAIGDLYSAYHLPNIFMVALGGILTDRMGAVNASILFTIIAAAGTAVVASARTVSLMMIGRAIVGIGGESLCAAQLALLSHCFGTAKVEETPDEVALLDGGQAPIAMEGGPDGATGGPKDEATPRAAETTAGAATGGGAGAALASAGGAGAGETGTAADTANAGMDVSESGGLLASQGALPAQAVSAHAGADAGVVMVSGPADDLAVIRRDATSTSSLPAIPTAGAVSNLASLPWAATFPTTAVAFALQLMVARLGTLGVFLILPSVYRAAGYGGEWVVVAFTLLSVTAAAVFGLLWQTRGWERTAVIAWSPQKAAEQGSKWQSRRSARRRRRERALARRGRGGGGGGGGAFGEDAESDDDDEGWSIDDGFGGQRQGVGRGGARRGQGRGGGGGGDVDGDGAGSYSVREGDDAPVREVGAGTMSEFPLTAQLHVADGQYLTGAEDGERPAAGREPVGGGAGGPAAAETGAAAAAGGAGGDGARVDGEGDLGHDGDGDEDDDDDDDDDDDGGTVGWHGSVERPTATAAALDTVPGGDLRDDEGGQPSDHHSHGGGASLRRRARHGSADRAGHWDEHLSTGDAAGGRRAGRGRTAGKRAGGDAAGGGAAGARSGAGLTLCQELHKAVCVDTPRAASRFHGKLALLGLFLVTYSSISVSLVDFATDMFAERWGYSDIEASRTTSVITAVAIVLTVPMAYLLDMIQRPGLMLLTGALLVLPGHALLLAVRACPPEFACILIGAGGSIVSATLWPALSGVIRPSESGTMLGFLLALQNWALCFAPMTVGVMRDRSGGYEIVLGSFIALDLSRHGAMPKVRKTKRIQMSKRLLSTKDSRLTSVREANEAKIAPKPVKNVTAPAAAMWFHHNEHLGPPYYVILDTNAINFAIKNKLDIVRGLMDCLLAKVIPCVTTCVIAELEKLGPKFRVALRLAKDPRFRRIRTEGDYADDNIIKLVTESKCYIVATCDKDLQRRIRKLPGVPIISIKSRRFTVERMPEAIGAPR